MVRAAIYGASGYTGLELLRLLARHPGVEVTALVTRQDDLPRLTDVHPSLAGRFDLPLENLSTQEVAERADVAFTALPHGASAATVSPLLEAGLKVIDLSADYRLKDPAVYAKWYALEHVDPARLDSAVYGLPELYRDRIREASLVANPGCYPTSAILALAPLLKANLIDPQGVVIDSKSGVSGAGRSPKPNFHFPECNESFSAYSVGVHRHMPEIDQVLSDASGKTLEVVFTPHLVPMDRGILSTCYATPASGATAERLQAALAEFYAHEPFVHVGDRLPGTKDVAMTNNCSIAVRMVRGRAIVVSVIDNLIKGASGAAVQNFNLMHGFAETTALI
ncbi:N-acetyl-gamma-glutamyl-phosphate reductase [Pirellulimonas nuda]|uniref:N-acetyl-gamma-glutamyl-phosphate reductase n=1 Tax=Pirellulimonas nuda TaxID=2528009 RepID=A0A518DGR0_9BACT|nr:N-acetyl-gamma-glutamyl-phosphate reductase [Pirellulimonas nuda]QDU90663.1 N-acetyl-gamma-glutamyl-phosphate reductase [Pirellulimonas nuda]